MKQRLQLLNCKRKFSIFMLFWGCFFSYAQYTLTDADVDVSNGVIFSCSYDFSQTDIVIPATLDGQTVTGIRSSVFSNKGITSVSLPSTLASIEMYAFRANPIKKLDLTGFANLTVIGYGAFYDNDIDTLYLTDCINLQRILGSAFYSNSIDTLSLEGCNKLWEIGATSFRGNNIAHLDLSSCTSLTEIESYAFYENSLENIDLSAINSLRELGTHAFANNSLSSLVLPQLDEPEFHSWLSSLKDFIPGNTEVSNLTTGYLALFAHTLTDEEVVVEDGVIVESNYNSGARSIIIPDELDGQPVIGIGAGVFYSDDIMMIDLPSSIQFIGDRAFAYNNIFNLNLNGYTELESIGAEAFYDNNFALVDLGNCTSLKSIGSEAFQSSAINSLNLDGCTSLQSIERYAFNYNNLDTLDLSSLTLLKHIGNSAFGGNDFSSFALPVNPNPGFEKWISSNGCEYENGATISDFEVDYHAVIVYTLQNDDVVVEDGVIVSCSYDFEENTIIIPDVLDGQSVLGIADSVFWNKGIIAIDFPAMLEVIGNYSFSDNHIQRLDLSGFNSLKQIYPGAFRNNELVTVNLRDCTSLKRIYSDAFRSNSIDSLILEGCDSLVSIDNDAFRDNRIKRLDLSGKNKLLRIREHAFYNNQITYVDLSNCSALESIHSDAFYNNSIDTLLIGGCSSLTVIYSHAFYSNAISEVDFSSCTALTEIQQNAFRSNAIESLNFTGCDALESIGVSAFESNSLTSVDLSGLETLEFIGNNAFNNNSISQIELPTPLREGFLFWQDYEGNTYSAGAQISNLGTPYTALFSHTLTDDEVVVVDGELRSCSYSFEDKVIIIPDELDGQTITRIDDYVFRYKTIKRITLPSTLETIGSRAFENCSLTNVDFRGHENLVTIGSYAFSRNNFIKVDLGNCLALKTIATGAFSSNSNLDTLYLNGCVALENIYTNAFSYSSLDTISLEGNTGLKRIHTVAFNNNQLDTVDLSSCTGLFQIDANAFANNPLSGMRLPSSSASGFIEWRDANSGSYAAGHIVSDLTTTYKVISAYTLTDDDVRVENGEIVSCSYNFEANMITIPDVLDGQVVKDMAANIFKDKGIVSITLPSQLETVAYRAFYSNELEEINWNGNTSLKSIEFEAFRGNKLKEVNLKDMSQLASIGSRAFYSNLIDTLNLDNCVSLRFLDEGAFYSNSLSSVDLSSCDSLTSIGEQAFASNNLSELQLPSPVIPNFIAWQDDEGNNYNAGDATNNLNSSYQALSPYTLTSDDVEVEDGVIVSCSYNFLANVITIPDTLDGQKIIGIGSYVFSNKRLKEVILPESLETIGSYAFSSNNLLNLDLNGYGRLRIIDNYAFQGSMLKKADLGNCTSLEEIGTRAFANCSIDTLILNGCTSLKTINDYAFYYNNISSLQFERCEALETIGNYAFTNNAIDTVDFSLTTSLRIIADYSFSYNDINSVNISSNYDLVYIGSRAFGNNNLDSIQLPTISSSDFVGWKNTDEGYLHPDSLYIYNMAPYYLGVRSYELTDEDVIVKSGVIVSCRKDLRGKAVVIPEILNGQRIIGIGENAFEQMGIAEMDLSQCSGLLFIEDYAFYKNYISSMDFSTCPALERIGTSAFSRNKIKSVDFSNNENLILIGSYSFYYNLLDTVDITSCNSLARIGNTAFDYNPLNGIVLPEPAVEEFIDWESTSGYSYSAGDTIYDYYRSYRANSIYTLKDEDVMVHEGIIMSCSYDFQSNYIIIPGMLDGQTIIGIADANDEESGVFAHKEMRGVQLPESIEFIGDYAFNTCYLDTLDFSQNTKLERIGVYAFGDCRNLRHLELPEDNAIRHIEDSAFYYGVLAKLDLSDCSVLETIGTSAFGMNYIDSLNFESCTALNSIGEAAFSSNNLTEVDLSPCISLDTLGRLAFYSNQISKVDFRGCDALAYIGPAAFNRNRIDTVNLQPSNGLIFGRTSDGSVDSTLLVSYGGADKEIDFLTPQIETIAEYAFINGYLTSVDFSDCPLLEEIELRAFDNSNLINVDFSSNPNLTSIGDYAFYSNEIEDLSLENCLNIEHIGKSAFSGNIIDTLDLRNKNKLITISDFAFDQNTIYYLNIDGCTALKTIGGGAFRYNSIDTLDLSTNAALTAIGEDAFYRNNLNTLLLAPDAELTRIGNRAFYYNNLDTVDIFACTALINIGKEAFASNQFNEIVLPSPTVAGFEHWINDKDSVLPGGEIVDDLNSYYLAKLPAYTLADDDVEVVDGVIIKAGASFKGNDIIIPDVLDGQTIIGISDEYEYKGVFAYRGLLSVKFPTDMEFIGYEAFYDNAIRTIDIANAKNLTKIGRQAFGRNALKSVSFDSCKLVKTIGGNAFWENAIDSINLNMLKKLESIGNGAFYDNSLDTVRIDECTALTYLGWEVFERNSELKGFVLPFPDANGMTLDYWYDSEYDRYNGGEWTDNFSENYSALMVENGYTVHFEIVDRATPISGINIELLGYGTQVSGEDGIAAFSNVLPDTDIKYTVTTSGNVSLFGSVAVVDTDVTVPVDLSGFVFNVSFTVTVDNTPVSGAEVTMADRASILTNSSGTAVYNGVTPLNGIEYVVSLAGYNNIRGTLDVVDADVNLIVNFEGVDLSFDQKKNDIKVFPNPASDFIYIEQYQGNEEILIFTMTGELVMNAKIAETSGTIDISNFKNGVYYLKINDWFFKVTIVR